MGWEKKGNQIAAEYAAGRPVAEIQTAWGLSADEAAYLEETGRPWEIEHRRGLQIRGNRIALGVLVGLLVAVFAGLLGGETAVQLLVWALTAVAVYALVTSYAGRDSSR